MGETVSELRKCEVKRAYESAQPGQFHQWASKLAYGEGENLFPVTYAIVELENGEVIDATPASVVFLDKQG